MKKQLMNTVRQTYGLPQSHRMHFQRSEMISIVQTITGVTPEWTSCEYFFEEELTAYGWVSQTTVDTHPTIQNLQMLLNAYPTQNYSSRMTTLLQILKESGYMNPTQMTVNESNIVITF